jgi:hypothetical protein
MNKTLLKHFTVIHPIQHDTGGKDMIRDESLHELVLDLKHVLLQAEKELLSPRSEAIKQLLQRALH